MKVLTRAVKNCRFKARARYSNSGGLLMLEVCARVNMYVHPCIIWNALYTLPQLEVKFTVVGALARKALVMLIFFMKFLVAILAWIDFI